MKETTLTIKTSYGSATISVPLIDMNVDEIVELLVRPALLGAGYPESSLKETLGEINVGAFDRLTELQDD